MAEDIVGIKLKPILIKGAIYQSELYGLIEFKGTDIWRGETSFHFCSCVDSEDHYLSYNQVKSQMANL